MTIFRRVRKAQRDKEKGARKKGMKTDKIYSNPKNERKYDVNVSG